MCWIRARGLEFKGFGALTVVLGSVTRVHEGALQGLYDIGALILRMGFQCTSSSTYMYVYIYIYIHLYL